MILAIDLGSTSFKAAIFDRQLRRHWAGRAKVTYRFAPGGRVELDVAGVHATLRRTLAAAGRLTLDAKAIAITSQAQTFTVVDQRGRAQRPFISWQDGRAVAACTRLKRTLPNFGGHSSFGVLLPALQVSQLAHRPPDGRALVLPLPSYLVQLWTGEAVTDDNLAAMSGLYSLKLGGWWPQALRACRLCEKQLPRVAPVGAVAGHTTDAARRFGLPAGIPVVLAGNDQTAGAYAAKLEENHGLLLTLGTAQTAYVCTVRVPRPDPVLVRGPYPGGRSYRMAVDSCGGNIINWASTVLAGCGSDRRFFAQAARGRHDLVFAADLDTGRGEWRNIGLHHTSADLAFSVLKSLSRRMAALVGHLRVPARERPVFVAGGGSAQPLWVDMVAEALSAKLAATDAHPLLGAARMAATKIGL